MGWKYFGAWTRAILELLDQQSDTPGEYPICILQLMGDERFMGPTDNYVQLDQATCRALAKVLEEVVNHSSYVAQMDELLEHHVVNLGSHSLTMEFIRVFNTCDDFTYG